MDHPRLFFAAFGDELTKNAADPAGALKGVTALAKKVKPEHLKTVAHMAAGAGLLAGGQRVHGDWKRGRELRLQEKAMMQRGY